MKRITVLVAVYVATFVVFGLIAVGVVEALNAYSGAGIPLMFGVYLAFWMTVISAILSIIATSFFFIPYEVKQELDAACQALRTQGYMPGSPDGIRHFFGYTWMQSGYFPRGRGHTVREGTVDLLGWCRWAAIKP